MSGNRKATEKLILEYIRKLEQGDTNYNLYKDIFKTMTDDSFAQWMEDLDNEKTFISLIIPNGTDKPLDLANVLKVGELLGVDYFQRIITTDPITKEPSLSITKYLVIDLMTRRQIQHLSKKSSIPYDAKSVDHLTGAVVGDAKGARISLPELLALESRGLDVSILELIKLRGGDATAYRSMIDQISETGEFTVETALEEDSTVTASETLKAILTALHYKNTI